MSEWIGVDLDGTLAHYDDWISDSHIGEPISLMVNRVKSWLSEGKEVKIITARIAHPNCTENTFKVIEDWCVKHLGQKLEITCKKDFNMIELWDDRCIQVEKNTGKRVDGKS